MVVVVGKLVLTFARFGTLEWTMCYMAKAYVENRWTDYYAGLDPALRHQFLAAAVSAATMTGIPQEVERILRRHGMDTGHAFVLTSSSLRRVKGPAKLYQTMIRMAIEPTEAMRRDLAPDTRRLGESTLATLARARPVGPHTDVEIKHRGLEAHTIAKPLRPRTHFIRRYGRWYATYVKPLPK